MIADFEHRISPEHRQREAIVYIRQSSPNQVTSNLESTKIQRGLREKAIALGWLSPRIIEDDLGITASGYADRPGFQELLANVAVRKVGIILCLDASRLSRNSKDWAHLFELCRFFDTLIADLEQIYDLTLPNDRLIIGIKGTISEMELTTLKNRLQAGVIAKAERGELRINLPAGYVHDTENRIVFNPDQSVQAAIHLLFEQFKRCTSIRQLALWYRDTKTLFPVRNPKRNAPPLWRIPTFNTLGKFLVHPVYAGAYVYGRRPTRIEYVEGKLVKRQENYLPAEQCRVCIRDHHPAYISWEQLMDNQARISDNKPRWKMEQNRGAIRDGLALLAGLLRCGTCGSKIYVSYKKQSALYFCDGGHAPKSKRCMAFGSQLIDRCVGQELCRALDPLSVQAAITALEQNLQQESREIENASMQVQAAQYEADRAFEQFDFVDPKNRLVADTLEQRLNEKLIQLKQTEEKFVNLTQSSRKLTEKQEQRLLKLAEDFSAVWDHLQADPTLKKRLLRTAVHEIIVTHQPKQQRLEVTIHWQGGIHTRFHVNKRTTPIGSKADPELVELVRLLAGDGISDAEIARILNMKKIKTPRALLWTQTRSRCFRKHHRIREAKRSSGDDVLTKSQAAAYLDISHNAILGLERIGAISRNQVTDFAPWRITRAILDSPNVQDLIKYLKKHGRLPKGGCSKNQLNLFSQE